MYCSCCFTPFSHTPHHTLGMALPMSPASTPGAPTARRHAAAVRHAPRGRRWVALCLLHLHFGFSASASICGTSAGGTGPVYFSSCTLRTAQRHRHV